MSDFYDLRDPRRTRRRWFAAAGVLVLVVVAVVVYILSRPGSPSSDSSPTAAEQFSAPSGRPSQSGNPATPAAGVVTGWSMPAAGVGGPSKTSAAGVPQGYTHDLAGAEKAGLNVAVASLWMRYLMTDPWSSLSVLAVPAEVRGGVYTEAMQNALGPPGPALASSGGSGGGTGPLGGRVLAVHAEGPVVTAGWETAVVVVLWERFAPAADGAHYDVAIEPFTVSLAWYGDDWLAFAAGPGGAASTSMPPVDVGQMPATVPLPAEGWYS